MDAVITYVDNTKINWKRAYNAHVKKSMSHERFRSWGTLLWQIYNIINHAPFFDTIYVVVSDLEQVKQYAFPSCVQIVTHDKFIPECYLPIFNSCTIEMFLGFIPGLSNEFVYFNDDTFIVNDMEEEDFFIDGKPCLSPKVGISFRSATSNMFLDQCVKCTAVLAKRIKNTLNTGEFYVQEHCARPMTVSSYQKVWKLCGNEIVASLTRTRHNKNFNIYLFNNYDVLTNNYVNVKADFTMFAMSETTINSICAYLKKPTNKMVCLNDASGNSNVNKLIEKLHTCIDAITLEMAAENSNNGHGDIALCAIAKNENLYIREWVEHYKMLGIDKIFLYDNNEITGEHFEDVIKDYIDSKFVEIINVRGLEKGCFYDTKGINLQPKCYIDCYEHKAKGFKWLCFFDVDEFLTFKEQNTLHDFLLDNRLTNYDTILVPWVHYDDNGQLTYSNEAVVKRFTRQSKNITYHAPKSIVRTGLRIPNKKQQNLIHIFTLKNNHIVNSDFTLPALNKKGDWYKMPHQQIANCICVLNHYKTKSLQEFCDRHLGRHWGTGTNYTLTCRNHYDVLKDFYCYNFWNNTKAYAYHKDLDYNAIIALTSWKNRIKYLPQTIDNLIEVCGNKYKIVITLSRTEFPNLMNDLPEYFKTADVEIIWVNKNYFCYKKVLFAMQKYPTMPIISADDDCLYKYNYADELYNKWLKNATSVITSLKENKYTIDGISYHFAHGCASLYPPSSLLRMLPYIEDDEILSRKNDDSLTGIYCKINSIPLIYIGHSIDEVIEFTTNEDAITWKIGSKEELKNKFIEDKKIFIKKLS